MKKILSLILAFVMVFSLLPVNALAVEDDAIPEEEDGILAEVEEAASEVVEPLIEETEEELPEEEMAEKIPEETEEPVIGSAEEVLLEELAFEAAGELAAEADDVPEEGPPLNFEYEGDAINFIKEDGSTFGMFAPQEGTAAVVDGDTVTITYVPKNTTVYAGFYLSTLITDEAPDEANYFALADGKYTFTLSTDYCGKATAVKTVKPNGATTSAQYYLAIPTKNQLITNQLLANDVILMIDAIGEVTAASKAAVKAAREAYDALTDAQKLYVDNYELLTQAEERLYELICATKFPYTGDVITFIDEYGNVLSQYEPQEGTSATFLGRIVIDYYPNEKTTYTGFYFGDIEFPNHWTEYVGAAADGNLYFNLSPDMAGYALPVAPVTSSGTTTDAQYYLAIPSLEKLALDWTSITANGYCGANEENLTWVLTDDGTLTISGTGEMNAYYGQGIYAPWAGHRHLILSVVLKSGVSSVGYGAFSGCDSLSNVTMGAGVTSIEGYAFCDCDSLSSVTLGENVTNIGESAFANCDSLISMTIPRSVTTIGKGAFAEDYDLQEFAVATGSVAFLSRDGVLFSSDGKTLVAFPGAKTGKYTIPEGVENIGPAAFDGCSITCLVIPEYVSQIQEFCLSPHRRLPMELYFLHTASDPLTLSVDYDSPTVTIRVPDPENLHPALAAVDWEERWWEVEYAPISDIPDYIIEDGLIYRLSGGEAVVVGPEKRESIKTVTIPAQVRSFSVTGIEARAFVECDLLTSIYISESVTGIGEKAFWACPQLTRIDVAESNPQYCNDAFGVLFTKDKAILLWAPQRLSGDYSVPSGVQTIGTYAFSDCESLTAVLLPAGLQVIEYGAFRSCLGLTSIIIPFGVTIIEEFAFEYCTNLTSVAIPTSVIRLGYDEWIPFEDCGPLDIWYQGADYQWDSIDKTHFYDYITIHFDSSTLASGTCGAHGDNLTWALADNGDLIITGNGEMLDYSGADTVPWHAYSSSILSLKLTEGVTNIGAFAFSSCAKVTNVTILGSLTSIGSYAFSGCERLVNVSIPESVTKIYNGAFSGCNHLATVFFGGSQDQWGALDIEDGNEALTNAQIVFSSGVISSGICGADGDNLTWVLADDGVLTVSGTGPMSDYDLASGSSLAPWYDQKASIVTVVINDGVTSIGGSAFGECVNLTAVTIPESVDRIGSLAFVDCDNLAEIMIPAGVTGIGANAFGRCGRVTVDGENAAYCSDQAGALYDIGKTALYHVPTSVSAFSIPESVTAIGDWAFDGCGRLTGLKLPSGVTWLGTGAFSDCSGLMRMVIPEGVTCTGGFTFSGCTALTDVTLPEGLTDIEWYDFFSCTELKEIAIPSSVERICAYAFYGCTGLTNINYLDVPPAIEPSAFQDVVATVWYPDDRDWSAAVGQNYGGSLTWNPYTVRFQVTFDANGGEGAPAEQIKTRFSALPLSKKVPVWVGHEFLGWAESAEAFEPDYLPGDLYTADAPLTLYAVWSFGQSIELNAAFLILPEGQTMQLNTNLEDRWQSRIAWTVDGPVGVIDVSASGLVTAINSGTAYVTASLEDKGTTYTARCRVDVVAGESETPIYDEVSWQGVRLPETKATVELFKTDYTKVRIELILGQNYLAQGNVIPQGVPDLSGAGAIESARFLNADVAALFALRPADDGTLEIIPKDSALVQGESAPKTIKGSYKTQIAITIEGKELTAQGTLTLTVKKSLPGVKAKAVKLNSAFRGDEQALVFTGATVTAVELDPAKTQPDWLRFSAEDGTVTYAGTANAKKSGKLYLLATVEGWAIKKAVTVSVSSAKTAPALTFKPAGLSLLPVSENFVQTKVTVTPAFFANEETFPVAVSRVTEVVKKVETAADSALACEYADGTLTIRPAEGLDTSKAHTFKVYLSVSAPAAMSMASVEKAVTVKTTAAKAPAVTLKASGAIDLTVKDSPATIKATSKDYPVEKMTFSVADVVNAKTKAAAKDQFRIDVESNTITLRAGSGLAKGTYTVSVLAEYAGGSPVTKTVNVTVKESAANKVLASVSLKAAGSIDVLRPGTTVTVTPTVKNNYTYELAPTDLKITKTYDGATKAKVSEDVTAKFAVTVENGKYVIAEKNFGTLCHTDKFSVQATVSTDDGALTSKAVALKVAQGKVKVAQSAKSVTLLKLDRFSEGEVRLTLADPTLAGIVRVEPDAKSAALFDLKDLGNGVYAIGYAGDRITTTKSATVKLRVFLAGNLTGTPNATISVKVNIK